jgi:hypothetical protein
MKIQAQASYRHFGGHIPKLPIRTFGIGSGSEAPKIDIFFQACAEKLL